MQEIFPNAAYLSHGTKNSLVSYLWLKSMMMAQTNSTRIGILESELG